MADIMAIPFQNIMSEISVYGLAGEDVIEQITTRPMHLSLPKAERDQIIALQRAAVVKVLPLVFPAANLRAAIPGLSVGGAVNANQASEF